MSEIKITVTLTRHYGAISTSFGIERVIEYDQNSDILKAYDVTCQLIEKQIDDYEIHRLPKFPAPSPLGIAGDKKDQPATKGWYPARSLICNVQNGKTFFNIIPGGVPKLAKYGASLYDEKSPQFTQDMAKKLLDGEFARNFPDDEYQVEVTWFSGKAYVTGFRKREG